MHGNSDLDPLRHLPSKFYLRKLQDVLHRVIHFCVNNLEKIFLFIVFLLHIILFEQRIHILLQIILDDIADLTAGSSLLQEFFVLFGNLHV